MKNRIISIIFAATVVLSSLSLSACDFIPRQSTTEQNHDVMEPYKPEEPIPEKTADEVYGMLKKHLSFEAGNVNYEWTKITQSTVNGDTQKDTLKINVGTSALGTDDLSVGISKSDSSSNGFVSYVGGWAYIYLDNNDDQAIKLKQRMTPAEVCDLMRESDTCYSLPFELSDFTSVKIEIVSNRYVLTLKGLTEEAYIRGVLGLNGTMASMAKEFYSFSPENYTATFVVKGSGALASHQSSTSYTFFATEENSGMEGTYEYTVEEIITAYEAIMVRVPSDADTYVEVNEK